MSDEIVRWLEEIKTLRANLAEACQERDSAYSSATNWQKRYETEAKQRRTEAQLMQHKLQTLTEEITALTSNNVLTDVTNPSDLESEIRQLGSVEILQNRLLETTLERDQLRRALQLEQENHHRTRQHLTAAVGDAVDQLAKERELKKEGS